jgi:hypothetical protein
LKEGRKIQEREHLRVTEKSHMGQPRTATTFKAIKNILTERGPAITKKFSSSSAS